MSVSKDKKNKRLKVRMAESEGRIMFLRTALAHIFLTGDSIIKKLTDPSEVPADIKLKALEEWRLASQRYINIPNGKPESE